MSEYTGTVLIMDGIEDVTGDIFAPDSIVNIKDGIPVTLEFDNEPDSYLGEAILMKNNEKIDYKIKLINDRISDQMARLLTPCIGGSVKKRDGKTIKEFSITSIALSIGNADLRIKKLGEE